MTQVELVADTNVVSYIFRETPLGAAYSNLIGERSTGITLLSVAESRSGVTSDNWGGRRIARLDRFLSRYVLLGATVEIANICGALLGRCQQVGLAMTWPGAWSAATALWLNVPLVTHDRDVEGIPGLRVVTVHDEWRVCEAGVRLSLAGALRTRDGMYAHHSPLT